MTKDLTPHMQHILELMASGHSAKTAGEALGRSEKTIRNQLATIYARLGVESINGAIGWYYRRRIQGLEAEVQRLKSALGQKSQLTRR